MADIASMIKTLREWLNKPEAERGKQAAQMMANKIPDPLMPKAGLQEAQRRRQMMDQQTEE